MTRFRDSGEPLHAFYDEFLVRCPRCGSCAQVRCLEPERTGPFDPRRFSCTACGAAKDWAGKTLRHPSPSDPADAYFHYPLWLQTRCCGHILWAVNCRHLDVIEAFVSAQLRERSPTVTGCASRSVPSRLPRWVQARQNREEILSAMALQGQSLTIAKLRQSL